MTPPATPETWAGTSISDRVWLGDTMNPWATPSSDRERSSHHTEKYHSCTPATTNIEEPRASRVTLMPQATMGRPALTTERPASWAGMAVAKDEWSRPKDTMHG